MAATNFTPISLYYSTTASAVPTAANLVPGELAINTNDGKLYYEDSSGVVQVLATKSTGSIGGSNTQVQFNNSGSLGGSSGLTWDGSFLTTSSIKNSALTSGRVTFAGASGLLSDSANLTFDGTTLSTVGITTTGNTILGNASSDTLNVGNGDLIKDASGNLGLGVTPSAWYAPTDYRAVQVGQSSFVGRITSGAEYTQILSNAFINSAGTLKYINNGTATLHEMINGAFKWYQAPSGTAGNTATFTQAMTLDASGILFVGTTSQIGATPSKVVVKFDNNNYYGLALGGSASGTAGMINFYNSAGTEQGYISSTGSGVTLYSTTSDYRLKENIVPMTGALAKVAQLKPVTYRWKESGLNGQGFIAHELAEVMPDCVSREKDAIDADGKPVYQGVDTSFLVATLTAAIQELKAEFDAYKATHP